MQIFPPGLQCEGAGEKSSRTSSLRRLSEHGLHFDFSPRVSVRSGGGKMHAIGLCLDHSAYRLKLQALRTFFPRAQGAKEWGKNACNRAPLRFFPRGYSAKGRGKNPNEPRVYGV